MAPFPKECPDYKGYLFHPADGSVHSTVSDLRLPSTPGGSFERDSQSKDGSAEIDTRSGDSVVFQTVALTGTASLPTTAPTASSVSKNTSSSTGVADSSSKDPPELVMRASIEGFQSMDNFKSLIKKSIHPAVWANYNNFASQMIWLLGVEQPSTATGINNKITIAQVNMKLRKTSCQTILDYLAKTTRLRAQLPLSWFTNKDAKGSILSEDERLRLAELKTGKTLEDALLDGHCRKKMCSIIEPYLMTDERGVELVFKVNEENKSLEVHVREVPSKDGD